MYHFGGEKLQLTVSLPRLTKTKLYYHFTTFIILLNHLFFTHCHFYFLLGRNLIHSVYVHMTIALVDHVLWLNAAFVSYWSSLQLGNSDFPECSDVTDTFKSQERLSVVPF